jgi:hypothetical protein
MSHLPRRMECRFWWTSVRRYRSWRRCISCLKLSVTINGSQYPLVQPATYSTNYMRALDLRYFGLHMPKSLTLDVSAYGFEKPHNSCLHFR